MLEHLVQLLPFQMGKLRGSEFLEVPTDGLRFHLRSAERGAALGPVPGACPSRVGAGRASSVQEGPRGILSRLLGVARPSAGSIVIYLSVCVYVSEFCGWEPGSE